MKKEKIREGGKELSFDDTGISRGQIRHGVYYE
jgi:hypothetical protein